MQSVNGIFSIKPANCVQETIARDISAATGKTVMNVPIDEKTALVAIVQAGLPPARGARLIGFYRWVRPRLEGRGDDL